jgi:hypothetical protein
MSDRLPSAAYPLILIGLILIAALLLLLGATR